MEKSCFPYITFILIPLIRHFNRRGLVPFYKLNRSSDGGYASSFFMKNNFEFTTTLLESCKTLERVKAIRERANSMKGNLYLTPPRYDILDKKKFICSLAVSSTFSAIRNHILENTDFSEVRR